MFAKPTKALMITLRRFVFRHEIFVEAREFDDDLIFVHPPKGRARKLGPRRNFEVFLLNDTRPSTQIGVSLLAWTRLSPHAWKKN
jgi:hypothetical protein